jgi:hypothetical protein
MLVHGAKIIRSWGPTPTCRQAVSTHSLNIIHSDALPIIVHLANAIMRRSIALLYGLCLPYKRCCAVGRYAIAEAVSQPHLQLGHKVTSFSSLRTRNKSSLLVIFLDEIMALLNRVASLGKYCLLNASKQGKAKQGVHYIFGQSRSPITSKAFLLPGCIFG